MTTAVEVIAAALRLHSPNVWADDHCRCCACWACTKTDAPGTGPDPVPWTEEHAATQIVHALPGARTRRQEVQVTTPDSTTGLDPHWDDWGWDTCIVCENPATRQGFLQLPAGIDDTGHEHLASTWVRAGWCDQPACVADANHALVIDAADAFRTAQGLMAAVFVAGGIPRDLVTHLSNGATS